MASYPPRYEDAFQFSLHGRLAVIEGDQETTLGAERISSTPRNVQKTLPGWLEWPWKRFLDVGQPAPAG